MTTRPFTILSFDGGGIEGLFSCRVLQRIIRESGKSDLLANVDMFAGTSTGSILAVALAASHDPDDIAKLYREKGPDIFSASFGRRINPLIAKFDNTALVEAVKALLGPITLGDVPKRVLVPTFRLFAIHPPTCPSDRSWTPKFFHNFPGPDSDAKENAGDVVVRSCSAPTYFPSYQGYVDGGVVNNNPTMAAIAQVLDYRNQWPDRPQPNLSDIVVISISTLNKPRELAGSQSDAVDRYQLGWAADLVQIMLSGNVGVAAYEADRLLGNRHARLSMLVNEDSDMADASTLNLNKLEQLAAKADITPALDVVRQYWP